ncbi:MAG: hypothetical protein M0Z99_30705 [Betaproteobacteria bacterium]|nr:hypothetical protein [Betaproteobacteria bacterium]
MTLRIVLIGDSVAAGLGVRQPYIVNSAAYEATNRVATVDVRRACARWSDFFADYFHPNANGHSTIARALIERLHAAPHVRQHSTPPYPAGHP